MRVQSVIATLALLLAVYAQAAETAPVQPSNRVPLVSSVVLHADRFTVDDLLPESAPAALHREAMGIVVGQSPQPAASRVLYRQQLQFLLRDHASLLAALRLPKQIVIRRFHRPITREEIVRAIDSALGRKDAGGKDALHPQDLQLSVPVYVTSDDAGLQVLRIAADPLRRETQFTLWTSMEPDNLPFTVTVRHALKLPSLVVRRMIPPGSRVTSADFAVEMRPAGQDPGASSVSPADLEGLETRAALRAGQPVARDQFKRPILVKPGALATLMVRGPAFSIKTVVDPLEQGVLGQEIRVRNSETRQVVEARVVGRDRLLKTL